MSDRHALAQALDVEATNIRLTIEREIRSYAPLGVASDLSLAMGARPSRGVLVGCPNGATYVFAKARCPKAETVERWRAEYVRADELVRQSVSLRSFSVLAPGTTIGNRAHAAHGRALADAGLLTPEEIATVVALERFWAEHPSARWGVVAADGTIETDADFDARLAAGRSA